MRERKGELVGNEDLCDPEGWEGPESCLRSVGPYGRLWLLAPSRGCGRMRCLGSAWLVLRKGAPPSFDLQEQLANQRSAEIFG